MIIVESSEHFGSTRLKSDSAKIDWPDNEIILPTADGTRLFLPEIVYQSSYTFDIIKRALVEKPSLAPQEHYALTLIDAAGFPYANGKSGHYFYNGSTTKMLDLSTIVQFSHSQSTNMFWLVSTANKEFKTRGCHLYSNLVVRDLTVSEHFAWKLEMMATSFYLK